MAALATLGTQQVLDAFAATVSYRLEPDGWGTRFPLVLGQLLRGRLEPDHCDAALLELDAIAAEARRLASDKVVWSLEDLARRDDTGLPVRRDAPSVYEYFCAEDGRPLVDVLREAVDAARTTGLTVRVWTPARTRAILGSLGEIAFGVAWMAVGWRFFPNLLVNGGPHGMGGHDGFLVWPMGLMIVFAGAWHAARASRPALAEWQRQHAKAVLAAGLAASGLLLWLIWRS